MTTKRNKSKRKTGRPVPQPSPETVDEIPENVKRAALNARQRIPGEWKYLDRSR